MEVVQVGGRPGVSYPDATMLSLFVQQLACFYLNAECSRFRALWHCQTYARVVNPTAFTLEFVTKLGEG